MYFVARNDDDVVLCLYRTYELYYLQWMSVLLWDPPGARYHCTVMNMSQQECCIKCDNVLRNQVIGVFAADQIPILKKIIDMDL